MTSDAGRGIRSKAARLGFVLLACIALAHPGLLAAETKPFKPFNLKTLDGTRKSLSDFSGKATLVVFFFPTCKYCNAAFPKVQAIYDTYNDQGLAMAWINAVPKEDRLVKEWLAKNGYTVPVLVGASMAGLQKDYGIVMTPTHFLVNPSGEVLFTQAGYEPGYETALEEAIRTALQPAP